MWTTEHDEVVARLAKAKTAKELFGDNLKRAKILYLQYCKLLHPDSHSNAAVDKATAAFQALQKLWSEYETALNPVKEDKVVSPTAIHINGKSYFISLLLAESPDVKIFVLKDTDTGSGQVIFPVSRKAVSIQINRLEKLVKSANKYPGCEYFFAKPQTKLFQVPQKDGNHTAVFLDIPTELSGAMIEARSLEYLRTNYAGMIHPKDMAWIWRRLLSVAAIYADEGVEWAFDPNLDLVCPETHRILPLSYLLPTTSEKPIQRAAMLMKELSINGITPYYVVQYFESVIHDKGLKKDYGQLLKDFDWVIEREWGRRKFHPFAYPEGWK
jgi:hypothetical protein